MSHTVLRFRCYKSGLPKHHVFAKYLKITVPVEESQKTLVISPIINTVFFSIGKHPNFVMSGMKITNSALKKLRAADS